MFRENLNGGMSMSVFGIATSLSSSLAKGYDLLYSSSPSASLGNDHLT
jgi:hypothetical protein